MLDEERVKKAMSKLMRGDPKMMIVVEIKKCVECGAPAIKLPRTNNYCSVACQIKKKKPTNYVQHTVQ